MVRTPLSAVCAALAVFAIGALPAQAETVVAVEADGVHTCAITSAGGLRCWGGNEYGQLGDGSTTNRLTPVGVDGLASGVTGLAAGGRHTCAITADGVKCWGSNEYGQLGDGTNDDRLTPVAVVGVGNDVTAIAAGDSHTCALTLGGNLKCWGNGGRGQVGDATLVHRNQPVAITDAGSGLIGMSLGWYHTCVITNSQGLRCWGSNEFGQLGTGEPQVPRATPGDVPGLAGVAAVSLGAEHSCVVANGAAKCWGLNQFAQLGDSSLVDRPVPGIVAGLGSGVASVAVGFGHTCALLANGSVKCWGASSQGQVGDGIAEPHLQLQPVNVVGLAGVTAITSGGFHACAYKPGAPIVCWGANIAGMVGDGSTTDRWSPVAVTGLVAAGGPPETTIDSGPPLTTTSTSGSFTFSGSAGTIAFECSIDASAFVACASPFAVAGLSVGAHAFAVRALNAVGRPDPTPATFAWTVQGVPAISVTRDFLPNFVVVVGTTRTFEVEIRSTGTGPLTLGTPVFNSGGVGFVGGIGFTIANGCGVTLAPGATCTITVTFTPTAARNVNEALLILNDASVVSIGFSGQVVAAAPAISITRDFLPNLVVVVGTTRTFELEIRSTGNFALTLGTPSFNSGGVGFVGGIGFTIVNGCGATLAPGATCTITVTFTPTAARNLNEALLIPNNASVVSIAFFGQAVAPSGDFDGDGIPNGVEGAEGRNPASRDNDVFGNPRLFAMQQYRDFLGREGDAGGIQFYVDLLNNGQANRFEIIESFLLSAEFQNGLPSVTRLYFSFFNRIPDSGGLQFQVDAFRAGTPLDVIAQNFVNSPEFTNRYGALNNDQYINLVYQNVLGRAPDPEGYTYYRTRLDSGILTKGQMMIGFSESPELQQITGNESFVVGLYFGLLKRTPEADGLDFYVDLLDTGTARRDIIPGFFGSPEYRNRFLP